MEFRVKLVNGEESVIDSCRNRDDVIEVLEILQPENSLKGAFYQCTRLEKIPEVLPACVEDITEMCKFCVMLDQFIELPRNCKVATRAFENCVSLTGRVKINDSLEEADEMFSGCVEFSYDNFVLANNGEFNMSSKPRKFKNTRSMFTECCRLDHPVAIISEDSTGMYAGADVSEKEVLEHHLISEELCDSLFRPYVNALVNVAINLKKTNLDDRLKAFYSAHTNSDNFDRFENNVACNDRFINNLVKKAEEAIEEIKNSDSVSASVKSVAISMVRRRLLSAYKASDFNMNRELTEAIDEFDSLAEDCGITVIKDIPNDENILKEANVRNLCNGFLKAVGYSATAVVVKPLTKYEDKAINDLARCGYEIKEDGKIYKVSERRFTRGADGTLVMGERETMDVLDSHTVNAGIVNRMSLESIQPRNARVTSIPAKRTEERSMSRSLLRSLGIIVTIIVVLLLMGRCS